MLHARLGLAFAALTLAAGLAQAQSGVELDDLDADRINADQVTIAFAYDGGACDDVGLAQLGELVDGTLAVNFPVTSTAEICTQQIVEIEVEQTIAAHDGIARIDVTLTGPDGTVIATASTSGASLP